MNNNGSAKMKQNERKEKISRAQFYGEYYGHPVSDLATLLPHLRESSDAIIWTAGDSSLDNKYWFSDTQPAVQGPYRDLLEPPYSTCDVTYWLNQLSSSSTTTTETQNNHDSKTSNCKLAAINTAVEATTLNHRTFQLRPQDEFLRDHLAPQDTLIVSIGGNDVALLPLPCTIVSMLGLISLPTSCIANAVSCGVAPCDDCCCGCGPSLASCACSFPPCFGYFRHLFGVRVQHYINRLVSKTRPKRILVCMIYYPDESTNVPSWADAALGALGYNSNPAKLQAMIRNTFRVATSNIQIAGTKVIPVPLFHILDGRQTQDFVARVEPSATGGRKMAEYLLNIIRRDEEQGDNHGNNMTATATTSFFERQDMFRE